MLAPTGTIAFMMDCDTTGIEPDIALIKYKKLVGEGFLKIVNQTVPAALRKLGYGAEQVDEILAYINERETIEGAPHLKPQHLPVFDCAFKPANGERSIHYMGHVRMMGAVQPFLSGAISKTVNMPEAATAEEIETVYLEGWKLGLKAIAVYRDNSKRSQPLSTGKKTDGDAADVRGDQRGHRGAAQAAREGPGRGRPAASPPTPVGADGGHPQVRHRRPRGLHHRRPLPGRPARRDLPQDGQGRLHGQRPDGRLRDDRLRVAPVRRAAASDLVNKFAHVRFEPSGFTGNQEIPIAKSIVDYIFRWLGSRFLSPEEKVTLGLAARRRRWRAAGRWLRCRCRRVPGLLPGRGRRSGEPAPAVAPEPAPAVERPRSQAPTAVGRAGAHEELAVIATNGHALAAAANGGSAKPANGNGGGGTSHDHPEPGRHEGELPDPGGRPRLRRLRLDHGPQRQLLQVPQLR